MPDVRVRARVSDEHFRAYQAEARRRGVSVETLVQQTVNCLLEELEQEEDGCRDVLLRRTGTAPERPTHH